jgi:3-isopropylmalate/(R)-2-methylmalate dehydratase small subunit
MQKFDKLQAIAAPLPMINIDTDLIYPKQFLKTVLRAGLGQYAFYDLRYNIDGSDNPDFVLNREPYRKAGILITGANFGSGSSREHAPWALLDMGLRCVIAPSFADIFYNNCFKNGILPITLPQKQIDELMKETQDNPDALITIDLEKQTVTRGNKFSFSFEIDPFRKKCLLNGLDDIGITLEKENLISKFEETDQEKRSWI